VRTRSKIKPVAMVATGGLLVVIAVTGTRALGRLDVEFRPLLALPGDAFQVVLLAAAVLCVPLLIVGMILRRRVRQAEERRELEWLQRLVFLAVLVAAVVVLRELLPTDVNDDTASDADLGRARAGPADVLWSSRTAILAVVLAATAVVMLWWRRHHACVPLRAAPGAGGDHDTAAVRAGEAVLDRAWDDPRAAVVGCYAAMEEALAETGDARGRAETPLELLQRAIAEGRLAAEPGRQLTELFLTARYSSAPMTSADVVAAREALGSIGAGVLR
jgi:Domain of unknown function (DUF4129)